MTIHPIDTIGLYIPGKSGKDFDLFPEHFKKESNEKDDVTEYHKTFYDENGKRPIFVKNDLQRNYTLVQFSAPKLIYGNSLQNFNLDDSGKLIQELDERLSGKLEGDFLNWNVSRLDVTQNVEVSNPIECYIQSLYESYTHNKRYKVDKFSNQSIVIKNNSRRFTLYDKKQEAIDLKEMTRQEAKGFPDLLRYEAQHKKAQHVKTSFNRGYTFSEVLTEGFNEQGRIFLLNSFDKLFCNNGRYDLFLDNLAILDLVMKYTKRGTLLKYIVRSFTDSGNIQHDFVQYEALLKAKGMTRQGIRKAIKELRDLLNLSKFRLPDLLDEIRTQLVA